MQSLLDIPREDKEEVLYVLAARARKRFSSFCRHIDRSYDLPPHLQILTRELDKIETGENKRLIVQMPPRHGKSETVSRKFPAYYIGKNPDKNVILSSYGFNLAKSFSREVRDTLETRAYRTVFNVGTSPDQRAVNDWNVAGRKGGMLATGVGGATTGYGADLFIIDDPFKNLEEAESELVREKVWGWYQSVVLTRLEPDARIVLVLTRWHRDDLAGRILEDDEDNEWTVINMPALTETEYDVEVDSLGRGLDEALWKERYSKEVLKKKKPKVGTRIWSALYQQQPQDPAMQKFKREWFQYYDVAPSKLKWGSGIDTATSQKSSADNMAMVTVGKDKDNFLYVEEVFCEKVSVTVFAKYVCAKQSAYKFKKINEESNNAGEAIKQRIVEVARETAMHPMPPIRAIPTSTDKMVRAMEFQHMVENGTLRFNRNNKKVLELIEHLINFDGKGGDIDDDVDALGFAIKAVITKGPRIWVLED